MKSIHLILKKRSENSIFLTLLFSLPLFILLPLGVDLFLPALHDIEIYFTKSEDIAKYSISIYLLFWGFGQLIWGKISDIIGRRKVALLGLIFFAIFSYFISTVTSEDSNLFLFYRAMQSFGGSACFAAIFAIIRDNFDGDDLGKAYSYLNGAIAIVPVSAPLIGAYILQNNQWQFIFTVYAILAIISLVWTYIFTTETMNKKIQEEGEAKIGFFSIYKSIITNRTFVLYLGLAIVGFFGIMFFITISPLYLIGSLGIGKIDFGWMFMAIALVYMIGSFATPLLVKKIGIQNTMYVAIIFYIIGGLFGVFEGVNNAWQMYIVSMSLCAVGSIILVSICPAYGLSDFKQNAGAASGLFSALNFAIASMLATLFATIIDISTFEEISLIYLLVGVVNLCLFAFYNYTNKSKLL